MPKSFFNKLSGSFGKILEAFQSPPPAETLTLESGDIDPLMEGTQYSQGLLRALYNQTKGENILLTLTPICQYQREKKWPTPPFVNVNLEGSYSTEKDNWLGYIPINEPTELNLERILEKRGNVNVHASIQKMRGEYWIRFYISDKYKCAEDEYIKTYVSHTKAQKKLMEKISCELCTDYIKVEMEKSRDGKQYIFTYEGNRLGTASCKKIDGCIGQNKVGEKLLSIKKFRFNDDTDNKHYSTLLMFVET